MNSDTPAFPSDQALFMVPKHIAEKYPDLVKEISVQRYKCEGLSKLEYLAGLAMQGILAHSGYYRNSNTNDSSSIAPNDLAKEAVAYASALLREIEGRK